MISVYQSGCLVSSFICKACGKYKLLVSQLLSKAAIAAEERAISHGETHTMKILNIFLDINATCKADINKFSLISISDYKPYRKFT